jgi:hypothetical protein
VRATLSLGTGKAQPPFGRSRAAIRAVAVTAAAAAAAARLATVNFPPLPPSLITLSEAQIARIKG